MTSDTTKGRSLVTVQAELRAIESGPNSVSDRGLHAHVDHLRREQLEARRARQRELEDELLRVPEGVPPA